MLLQHPKFRASSSQLKEQLQSQGLRLGDVSVDVSQKEFEADGQSMKDSGERGQGSERDQDSQRAEEEQTAINKNKKRKEISGWAFGRHRIMGEV